MEASFKLPKLVPKPDLKKEQKYRELPRFDWGDVVKQKKLGSGSFGSVYLAKQVSTGKDVVVKKLKSVSIDSQTRFLKEAKLLDSIKSHRNIAVFLGFCSEPHSIMMQYSCYNFGHFGVEKCVSSLADFLHFVDAEFDFASFSEVLPVCVKDILTGLDYLHSSKIAHRDLKPSNVLVCNQHLGVVSCNKTALARAYEDCPIVCRLTDFGLSRSVDIQTKSVVVSKTTSVACGTPAYMAPEMQLNQLLSADQDDLIRADIWSLGLVVHTMINPDLGSPYRAELERSGIPNTQVALKDILAKQQLPEHGAKHEELRITSWWRLEEIFDQCATFDAMARPSAAEMLNLVNRSLVDIFRRFPFSVSQSTALEKNDVHLASHLQENVPLCTSQNIFVPPNDATNCCAFLSLAICDKLLHDTGFCQLPHWECVREIVEDIISYFPSKVNKHRDFDQFYDVAEAHSILSANNLLFEAYELSEDCISDNKVFSSAARQDILESLGSKLSEGEMCMGIYSCSPYIFTIGICNNNLFVVDTHPVNEDLGGNGNGVLLVTPDSSYGSCKSVIQWLLQRLKLAGVKGNQNQSMVWLTSHKEKPIQSGHRELEYCKSSMDEDQLQEEKILHSLEDHTKTSEGTGQQTKDRGQERPENAVLGSEEEHIGDENVDNQSKKAKYSLGADGIEEIWFTADQTDRREDIDTNKYYKEIDQSLSSPSSDDEDLPEGYCDAVRFYNEDTALPVYQWGCKKGVATDAVAMMLIQEKIERSRIATKVPTNVSKNTVFVVDTSKLCNGQDVKCDDMGAWLCTGSRKIHYSIDDTGGIIKETGIGQQKNKKEYQLNRHFFKNKSAPSVRKIMITAHNEISHMANDLCFIQYIFEEGEQEVVVQPHGNSKKRDTGTSAYRRTMKSTKDLIMEKLTELPPRKTTHEIIKERGGIMKVRQSGEFPRNRTQVYNMNRKLKHGQESATISSNDPLLQVIVKAKEEQKGRIENMLIREVPLFPEPIVFLASEQQLQDIERFCTNPSKFCVLGVDATFQIAGFYFTFTTYRNLMLRTEKGNHPVFIGPGILHKQKLYTSYKTLPLLMSKYRTGTDGVLVYGTDGEENMAKALSDVYPNAKHLRCDIHMRDNVKRKLSQLGITAKIAAEIMFDIFGKRVDGGLDGGLVDCTSNQEFENAVQSLTAKWIGVDKNGSKFVEYFLKEKADVIRETATAEIRSVCGLGYPPKVYTQNANECMNRLVKAENDSNYSKKESSLLPCIERIRNEIQRQKEEQFLAVFGRGQYQLTDEFLFMKVEERNFYTMTDLQKKSLKKKFFSIKMTETPDASSTTNKRQLSVSVEDAQIIDIPFPLLKGIFEKAATLASRLSDVWKVPTNNSNTRSIFMVSSSSSENAHKVVVFAESGKISCDQECVSWCTYSLCAHTVAVAETQKCLREFLNWFKKQKRSPNLSSLAQINMPQNKGRKSGTRKRKGSANKKPAEGLPVVSSRIIRSRQQQFDQPTMFQSHEACATEANILPNNDQMPWTNDPLQGRTTATNSGNQLGGLTPTTSLFQHCVTTTNNVLAPPLTAAYGQQFAINNSTYQTSSFPSQQPQGYSPAKQKPELGSFAFARLPYLDSRVSRCYGCGELFKPGGILPLPPNDLVLTTRLHRRYHKDGRVHISPAISSVYLHVNLYCARAASPDFSPALCLLPNDLIPFLQQEYYNLIYAKLGLNFAPQI